MRLAVDVMGGDHGPEELLQGVKLGLADDPSITRLHVVGPPSVLEPILRSIFSTASFAPPWRGPYRAATPAAIAE